jgi:hypothetical protein
MSAQGSLSFRRLVNAKYRVPALSLSLPNHHHTPPPIQLPPLPPFLPPRARPRPRDPPGPVQHHALQRPKRRSAQRHRVCPEAPQRLPGEPLRAEVQVHARERARARVGRGRRVGGGEARGGVVQRGEGGEESEDGREGDARGRGGGKVAGAGARSSKRVKMRSAGRTGKAGHIRGARARW